MIKLKDLIVEGVNDPGILKAVFLAGGPGSGKSFVAGGLYGIPKKKSVSAYGLKMVNTDSELERMLNKYGFGTDLDDMPEVLVKQLTDPKSDEFLSKSITFPPVIFFSFIYSEKSFSSDFISSLNKSADL